MRDLGPKRFLSSSWFLQACAAAAFPNYPTQSCTTSCNRYRSGDARWKPSEKENATGAKAPLDASLTQTYYSTKCLMGMGSPDNRRKADGSYQREGVGGTCFPLFAFQNGGETMLSLPVSLMIGMWLVAAMWIVGLVAYYFELLQ